PCLSCECFCLSARSLTPSCSCSVSFSPSSSFFLYDTATAEIYPLSLHDALPILADMNWLETAGRPEGSKRPTALQINSIPAIKLAVERGAGIAILPDYVVEEDSSLVQVMPDTAVPSFDTYFCYPDAMKNQAKLQVFRDFLITKSRSWAF